MTRANINCFYRNMFGKKVNPLAKLKRPDLEVQCPRGTKGLTELVLAEDIFENPTLEQRKSFDQYWTNKFYVNKPIIDNLEADEFLNLHGF